MSTVVTSHAAHTPPSLCYAAPDMSAAATVAVAVAAPAPPLPYPSALCSGWGFKAQQVLGAVRGKDFRHEKTKKKRGSYKGGNIDPHATFSYKFDSDDE